MHFFILTILLLLTLPFTAQAQSDVIIVPVKDNLHMLMSPQGGTPLLILSMVGLSRDFLLLPIYS